MTLVNWTQSYAEDRGMIRCDGVLRHMRVLYIQRLLDFCQELACLSFIYAYGGIVSERTQRREMEETSSIVPAQQNRPPYPRGLASFAKVRDGVCR